ncbi:MAG: glycosyltransferase family 10 domain-containing protein [Planctomycetota bacterium]
MTTSAPPPRPHVRLGFAGFWDSFDPRDNYFTRLLGCRYDVEVCDRPDFLIHSCIGKGRHDHRRFDCVRIFYTGENVPADWLSTDWAFTFEHDPHPRHVRLPHWPFYVDPRALVKPAEVDVEGIVAAKRRFCGFVVSNPLCHVRNEFFRRLSRYKPVDSGGRVMNTLGHRVADKRAFLAECRFTIAFENESHPGYTTEKIVEPMLVDSIPIYWGDPLIGREFDTRSLLSAHDCQARRTSALLDELVERVVAVDRDPDLLRGMLATPWLRNNRVPSSVDEDRVLEQFARIFATPVEPVARRRRGLRLVGLDRVPDAAGSLRRRLRRKWRQWTCKKESRFSTCSRWGTG